MQMTPVWSLVGSVYLDKTVHKYVKILYETNTCKDIYILYRIFELNTGGCFTVGVFYINRCLE